MHITNQAIGFGVATVLGLCVVAPATGAPVLSNTAALKSATDNAVTDVRWGVRRRVARRVWAGGRGRGVGVWLWRVRRVLRGRVSRWVRVPSLKPRGPRQFPATRVTAPATPFIAKIRVRGFTLKTTKTRQNITNPA